MRRAVARASVAGVPIPGFSSALSYYDLVRAERTNAALTQALRDFFGSHTYRRIDTEGTFHTEWSGDRSEVEAVDGISGRLPKREDLNLEGLDVTEQQLDQLFALDPKAWGAEADLTEESFALFGDKLPEELTRQLAAGRRHGAGGCLGKALA